MNKKYIGVGFIFVLFIGVGLSFGLSNDYNKVAILSRNALKFFENVNFNGYNLTNIDSICLQDGCENRWANITVQMSNDTDMLGGQLANFFHNGTSTVTCTGSDKVANVTISATGAVSVDCGVDDSGFNIKAGSIASISEGSSATVTFNTAFSGIPNVVVNFEGNVNVGGGEKGATLSVYTISTTGFTVRYDAASPTVNPATNVQWMATDAGDP